jgi:muramoyltetrapeptide carboxypeptidase
VEIVIGQLPMNKAADCSSGGSDGVASAASDGVSVGLFEGASEGFVSVSWNASDLPWRSLQRGSTVAVISPSGPVDTVTLEQGLLRLRSWGLQPIVGAHCTSVGAITAGPDRDRAADLFWALTDPSIEAVLVARGGYGMLRNLDLIDWKAVNAARVRPVVGTSDITALHEALRVHTSWASLMGPHVAGLLAKGPRSGLPVGEGPLTGLEAQRSWGPSAQEGVVPELLADGPTHDAFVSVLCGERAGTELMAAGRSTAYWDSARVIRNGSVTAPWFGGNLAVLASLCGSAEGVGPTVPFVAVLEDVNEAPYRVDRMLTQLLRAGWFANAVGVVCGEWIGCGEGTALEDVLLERLGFIAGPFVLGAPFGHGDRHLTLPLGVPISLNAQTTFTYQTSTLGKDGVGGVDGAGASLDWQHFVGEAST